MATALRHDLATEMRELGQRARAAAQILATTPRALKDQALRAGADRLRARESDILAANAKDMTAAQERGLRASLLDRLALDATRIEATAAGLAAIAELEDPVGTACMAASGRPASRSPSCRHARIARDEKKLSEPPRRIAALPALRHRAPASAVTFGRDS